MKGMKRGGGKGVRGNQTHLGTDSMTRSAFFPTSMDPHTLDRPREAAALIVAATSDSSIVRRRLTQARCITSG